MLAETAGVEHVQCDAVNYGAVVDFKDFGRRVFPSFQFGNAKAVVSSTPTSSARGATTSGTPENGPRPAVPRTVR